MDFGVKLSDAAVQGITLRHSLDSQSEVNAANIKRVDTALIKSIPLLLMTPSSFGEGAISISKAQHDSILQYYQFRCAELGINDELAKKPKVKFL